jgi:hypothetical protein
VLIVTHDLEQAGGLADRVGFLREGRKIMEGAPRALIEQAFGQEMEILVHLTLEPDSVIPDSKSGTEPFVAAAAALQRVEGNLITVRAPETPSVLTYRFSVADENGNVSVGLLVVRAVVESTPAYPQVLDTYLSFADRSRLITGVDVVTNKVAWSGGQVSGLRLALWSGASGFTASGWSILGAAPDRGAVIPFSLTGTDFAGNEVVSYGFLRIPPLEAAILTLKQDAPPVSVREEDSVTFNMNDLVGPYDLRGEGVGCDLGACGAVPMGRQPALRGPRQRVDWGHV